MARMGAEGVMTSREVLTNDLLEAVTPHLHKLLTGPYNVSRCLSESSAEPYTEPPKPITPRLNIGIEPIPKRDP